MLVSGCGSICQSGRCDWTTAIQSCRTVRRAALEKFSLVLATNSDMVETGFQQNEWKGCGGRMKNTIAAVIATATLGLALTTSAQVPAGRIVTVDLNKVFNDYYKTPIASAKLKETADSFNKENDDLVASYKKEIDELNKLRDEQEKP